MILLYAYLGGLFFNQLMNDCSKLLNVKLTDISMTSLNSLLSTLTTNNHSFKFNFKIDSTKIGWELIELDLKFYENKR